MTPHGFIRFPDQSIAVRLYRGGRWTTGRGPTDGGGNVFDCDASRFVDDQNRHVRDFHQESVKKYVGKGEAA